MLRGITSKQEALQILEEAPEGEENVPLALARMLCGNSAKWSSVQALLLEAQEISPESLRLTVLHYATAIVKNARSEKEAGRILAVVDCFSGSWNPSEKLAPMYLAVGRLLLE
jgi:hypothetical protein